MLQRIRLAMQGNGAFAKAQERVEVDETFIGGKARNMHRQFMSVYWVSPELRRKLEGNA